jgi:hypothetical protein
VTPRAETAALDPEAYCRELEAYLCRKNDGHLIRIAGPAFDRVSGWAQQGIPLKVACAGVDRYFERYYRRGPRRRPVRIEFCEADILDAFDAWRRAVGVVLPAPGSPSAMSAAGDVPEGARRRLSLAAHVERTIARLTALRSTSQLAHKHQAALEAIARELDVLLPDCRRARGDARDAILDRLRTLDGTLMTQILADLDAPERQSAEAEARESLGPFRDRMAPEAYRKAIVAAVDRQVRERLRLPVITFE